MTSKLDGCLLTFRDAQPVRITNPDGRSLILLVGDHAGNLFPQQLRGLGLSQAERARHIARDLGIAELGASLAARLDATFIEQRYSRLVIDCNRSPGSSESIAQVSDGTPIPGNAGLSTTARRQRYTEIFEPYHDAITAVLCERDRAGRRPIVVSLHSFTPLLQGVERPWDIGILYDRGETTFARHVLGGLLATKRFVIGDNEPYRMDDTDYTVPLHAYAAQRPYVELEVRQDRLVDASSRRQIVGELTRILRHATV